MNRLLAFITLAGGIVTCAAQAPADPTRPLALPAAAASASAGAGGLPPAAAAPASAPQLQSVQTSRQGAPSALVDGRVVRIGDRVGAGAVIAIDGQGLTLRSPRGSEHRLLLAGGIRKTPSGTTAEPGVPLLAKDSR